MKAPQRLLLNLAVCAICVLQTRAQQPTDTSLPSSSQNSSIPTAAKESANAADRKTKKIWSEDDLHKLGGGVSVVGEAKPDARPRPSTNPGTKNSATAHYKEQIDKLQAQLDDTNKKLAELQNFNGDKSTSTAVQMNRRFTTTSVPDQIAQLETKKKQIAAQMQDIFDQARRSGIEPGALR